MIRIKVRYFHATCYMLNPAPSEVASASICRSSSRWILVSVHWSIIIITSQTFSHLCSHVKLDSFRPRLLQLQNAVLSWSLVRMFMQLRPKLHLIWNTRRRWKLTARVSNDICMGLLPLGPFVQHSFYCMMHMYGTHDRPPRCCWSDSSFSSVIPSASYLYRYKTNLPRSEKTSFVADIFS